MDGVGALGCVQTPAGNMIDDASPQLFRHHVRRPRLTRILERATAQAIVLTAPAGYGKTTLVAEWLHVNDRVAWYRPTPASADVAAFSVELAQSADHIVPLSERLAQRARLGNAPDQAVRPLAELLAEEFAAWPDDAWLVIDDYHAVSASSPVDAFVDWLLTLAPVRIIVTTRRRPTWCSARRLLYGEIFEMTQTHLAMTNDEASEALAHHPSDAIEEFITAAHGWPALIGLAALAYSGDVPTRAVSDTLFRYFADEVLRSEPPDIQAFMLAASVVSHLTPEVVKALVTIEDPDVPLAHLTDEGLLHRTAKGLEFHPLIRDFLRRRLEELDPDGASALSDRAITYAREVADWDEAFELASASGRRDMAAAIIGDAGAALLTAGRVETIDKWFTTVGPTVLHYPQAVLTRGETLLRQGHFSEAEALIEPLLATLRSDDPCSSHAWYLLGQAKHLTSDYEGAVQCHREARGHATNPTDEARAAWGALIAAAELEPGDLDDYVATFEDLAGNDVDSRLRVASGRLLAAEHGGTLSGAWDSLRCVLSLSHFASDPMAVSNALANASWVNIARSQYDVARGLADEALSLCSSLRLDFAVGYCLVYRGMAEVGLRDFTAAHASLAELDDRLAGAEDPHLRLERAMLALRLSLATNRSASDYPTVGEGSGIHSRVPCASHGKYLALRAFTKAIHRLPVPARSDAREAMEITRASEAQCLARFAVIVADVVDGAPEADLVEPVAHALESARRLDCLDSVVVAYRCCPTILTVLSRDRACLETVESLLVRANDVSLSHHAGIDLRNPLSSRNSYQLTPREHEVMELVASGLTTVDIAEHLFISRSTAKVHIHRIMKKLGVKTRVQAVVRWHQSPPNA